MTETAKLEALIGAELERMNDAGCLTVYETADDRGLTIDEYTDLFAVIYRALSRPAVKGLGAWRRGYCDELVTIEQASTGFGSCYQVRVFDGKVWLDLPDQRKEEFGTVESAKAAAQSDFEQRIQSALEQPA